MKIPADKGLSKDFYRDVIKELERVAGMVRDHPELNHKAAERLLGIVRDIRKDAGLEKPKPRPKMKT